VFGKVISVRNFGYIVIWRSQECGLERLEGGRGGGVIRTRRERAPRGAVVRMDYPQPSGLTDEGAFASAYTFSVSKDDDWWAKAEDQTAELIRSIQPIQPSEERRQAVVDFVQRLIKKCSTLRDCQVTPYTNTECRPFVVANLNL
jgi:hypothetical protein